MALATAALELLILGVRRWQGSFTGSGAEVVWMAPAGYLLLFGVPALVVSPSRAGFRGFRWPRIAPRR